MKSVLFFFLSLPCVPNHLLWGDIEKETVEKPEKTFYDKQAAQLNRLCININVLASRNFKTATV